MNDLYNLCVYCDSDGEEYKALKEKDIGVIRHDVCDDHGLQIEAETNMYAIMGACGQLATLSNETRKKMFPMLFGTFNAKNEA